VRGREIITRPIKGTRARGKTQEEDEKIKKELLESEKDLAELAMRKVKKTWQSWQ